MQIYKLKYNKTKKNVFTYKNIAGGFATNYIDILIDKSAISIYVSFGNNILIGFSTR